jgi:hypothetical protein
MLGKTTPGKADMVDEEGGEMDLLSVQLLLWNGNQLSKILMHKHPDALLLLQSLCTGHCCLCRGGGGN